MCPVVSASSAPASDEVDGEALAAGVQRQYAHVSRRAHAPRRRGGAAQQGVVAVGREIEAEVGVVGVVLPGHVPPLPLIFFHPLFPFRPLSLFHPEERPQPEEQLAEVRGDVDPDWQQGGEHKVRVELGARRGAVRPVGRVDGRVGRVEGKLERCLLDEGLPVPDLGVEVLELARAVVADVGRAPPGAVFVRGGQAARSREGEAHDGHYGGASVVQEGAGDVLQLDRDFEPPPGRFGVRAILAARVRSRVRVDGGQRGREYGQVPRVEVDVEGGHDRGEISFSGSIFGRLVAPLEVDVDLVAEAGGQRGARVVGDPVEAAALHVKSGKRVGSAVQREREGEVGEALDSGASF